MEYFVNKVADLQPKILLLKLRNCIKAFTAKQVLIYFKHPDGMFPFSKHALIRKKRTHRLNTIDALLSE